MSFNPNVRHSVRRRVFLQATGLTAAGLWIDLRQLALADHQGRTAGDNISQLIVRSEEPLNAEPALEKLIQSRITPVEHFYIRNHAATPQIDASQFRLTVDGLVHRPLQLSIEQLQQQFPQQTVEATLTCAGNRRIEFNAMKPVGGVQWDAAAIGNAEWGGAALSKLLQHSELQEGAKHVWFEGLDKVQHGDETIAFGGSIPLDKAMAGDRSMPGALVVYEMNGRPLSPDHGYPLRSVVPGYIGARSVKWLGKIVVSDRPSPNHYIQGAYKLVTRDDDEQLAAAEPIQVFPINSAICSPAAGALIRGDRVRVRGYAMARGEPGRTVARVEVSADGGQSWSPATMATAAKAFCWRLWQLELAVSADTKYLVVRATDSAGHTQPEHVDWNLKGYLFNAWHRVPVRR